MSKGKDDELEQPEGTNEVKPRDGEKVLIEGLVEQEPVDDTGDTGYDKKFDQTLDDENENFEADEVIKKAKNIKQIELPNTSYLLKEIPLFKFEWLFWMAATMIAAIIVLFDYFDLSTGHMLVAVLFPLGLGWALYIIKMLLFMPTGKKVIVEKFYPNRGVHWEVREVGESPNNLVYFDSQNKISPTIVTDPQKHHHMALGKPYIIAIAGQGQNASVIELSENNVKNEINSKQMSNMITTVWGTAVAYIMKRLTTFQGRVQDPMFWIVSVTLIASAITALLAWSIYSQMGDVVGLLDSINTTLGSQGTINAVAG